MAFHFEKPSGFNFKAGQFADVTLTDPPEIDAEGNTRTFSIASPPFENELVLHPVDGGRRAKVANQWRSLRLILFLLPWTAALASASA
jgi:NAD(P)H-flavin reductase